jgi:hypothetical protein
MAGLSPNPQSTFQSLGYTRLRHVLDPLLVEAGRQEAVMWGMIPPLNGRVKLYEEMVNGQKVPARIEGVSETTGALGQLAQLAKQQAEKVCGHELALFKDKINFKYPGAGQFVAHQDSPAYYPHGSWHVSVLVPLMPFTEANGALEIAPKVPLCPMAELQRLIYTPAPVSPGDCLIFDGLTPHRSGPNTTQSPRIGLYMTFVNSSEAEARVSYEEAKKHGTKGLSLGQVDFTGNLVPSEHLATTDRVHL